MTNIGPAELLVLALIGVFTIVPLAVGIFAIVDVAQRTDAQFVAAGQSRTTWLIVAIVSLVVPCVFLGAAYYLVAIRPKLPDRRPA